MVKKEKNLKNELINEIDNNILTALIKNPRASDISISKSKNIPIKKINRRRNLLEQTGIIKYFTMVDNFETGTKKFSTTHFISIKFKYGINRKQVIDFLSKPEIVKDKILKKHIFMDWISDSNAKVSYQAILVSRVDSDILEIINTEIIPRFMKEFGKDSISQIDDLPNLTPIRIIHNYFPRSNIENGKIKNSHPDDEIFTF